MSAPQADIGWVTPAAEVALRAKLRALSNVLLHLPDSDQARVYGNVGQLISDVLTGELDPRIEEVVL